ncbi:hypothetical protein F4679DRAFT_585252 [Xylaria curta]|nr:hypothetical protein F4679DRAFT_585252 [Xylaria curta]
MSDSVQNAHFVFHLRAWPPRRAEEPGLVLDLYESATLPLLVNQLAREKPQSLYGIWPADPTSYSAGVRTITYRQLEDIINSLAWFLTDQLSDPRPGQILVYIGPNDVRTTALLLAAVKIDNVLFLTSPRNSPTAHRGMFERLRCNVLVMTNPTPSSALPVQEAVNNCRTIMIPGLNELLKATGPPYSSDKTLDGSRSDPFRVIHTSGSTGIPKPLVWTHETAVRAIEATSSEPPDGLISVDALCGGKRVLSALPPFHGAGLAQWLLNGIPFGNTTVVPAAAGAIVTADALVHALRHTPAEVAILVPSVIAELAQSPDLLDFCAAHLELIIYIGGDLPQAIGDRVAAKIRLRSQWGASEVGIPPQVFGFEDPAEYRARDLFESHPTVPDTWRWRARADDIVVFLNVEKTNPVSMGQFVVANNPTLVSGAIAIGAQRFQAALIIEPKDLTSNTSMAEKSVLIERVWPSGLIRAGKGTIQRAASVAQYTDEIGKLYRTTEVTLDEEEDKDSAVELGSVDIIDTDLVSRLIWKTVRGLTGWTDLDESASFFEMGMDPLQALQLDRTLRKSLRVGDLALSTILPKPSPGQQQQKSQREPM